jgi:hypothetical protein
MESEMAKKAPAYEMPKGKGGKKPGKSKGKKG